MPARTGRRRVEVIINGVHRQELRRVREQLASLEIHDAVCDYKQVGRIMRALLFAGSGQPTRRLQITGDPHFWPRFKGVDHLIDDSVIRLEPLLDRFVADADMHDGSVEEAVNTRTQPRILNLAVASAAPCVETVPVEDQRRLALPQSEPHESLRDLEWIA